VALQFREQGFTEAYALLGGFKTWQSAGFPVQPKVSPEHEGNNR
jgi:rhodanese-related sulfurtransferase